MKDPQRLLDGEASGLERLMLDAALGETPSAALQVSMARGLGFSGAGLSVAPPAIATVPATAATVATTVWISAGIVVAAVVAGVIGVRAVWSPRAPQEPPSISASPPPASAAKTAGPETPPRRHMGDEVAAEIRLLDGARAALQAGVSGRALGQLGAYDRRHPRGTLRPEALVLRIEALQQDGRRREAVALSRRFLATYPDSPLCERVERVSGLHPR